MVLHAAPSLEALMLNPGNKFHALKAEMEDESMKAVLLDLGGEGLSVDSEDVCSFGFFPFCPLEDKCDILVFQFLKAQGFFREHL